MPTGGVLQNYQWHLDTSWSTGAKPVTNDQALVEPNVGADKTVIDTGGTAEGIDLALLQTHPDFHGNFGSVSAPIRTAAALTQVRGGNFYMECHKDGASGFKCDRIEIACNSRNAEVQLGSDADPDHGELVDIYHSRGRVLLKGNSIFNASSRVTVGSIDDDQDAYLEINNAAPTLAALKIKAGTARVYNTVTNLDIYGGVVYKDTAKAVNVELVGGILYYDHEAIAADATTIVVHRGAVLHLWRNAVPKTLSTVIFLPGSIVCMSPHAKLHAITTEVDMGARRIHSVAEIRQIERRYGAAA